MKIKLTKEQFDYLNTNLLLQDFDALLSVNDQFLYLKIDISNVDFFRDWASDQLQKVGFDINYDLTNEGKLLEDFIDKLCIDETNTI